MKLLLFTCAGSFSVDQQSNAVSVFNIVERIVAPAFPCGLPDVTLVAMVRRDDRGPDLALRLVATLGEHTLIDTPFEMKFPAPFSEDGRLARGFGRLAGLPVPGAGTLSFQLWRGNQKWGEWCVEMVEARAEAQPEPIPAPPAPVRKPALLN